MLRTMLVVKECGFRVALALAMILSGAACLIEATRVPTAQEAAAAAALEMFAKPVVSTAMVGWFGAAACVLGLVFLVVAVREARRWVAVE